MTLSFGFLMHCTNYLLLLLLLLHYPMYIRFKSFFLFLWHCIKYIKNSTRHSHLNTSSLTFHYHVLSIHMYEYMFYVISLYSPQTLRRTAKKKVCCFHINDIKWRPKEESGCIGSTKHLNKFTIIVHPSRSIFNYQLNAKRKKRKNMIWNNDDVLLSSTDYVMCVCVKNPI